MTKKNPLADGSAENYRLNWQGRKITISYEPRSYAGTAHLQIRVRHCRPLPITETGYRSHFASPVDVEQLGGPVAYVEAWLDAMAQTKAWKRTAREGYQMTLSKLFSYCPNPRPSADLLGLFNPNKEPSP